MISNNFPLSTLPIFEPKDCRVSVGCYTYGNPRLMLWSDKEKINIGKYCSIAENVTIFGGGEHRTDWVTSFPISIAFNLGAAWQDGIPATKGQTLIGNDVWIGYGSTILSGVTIGDGAVVGACSVVTKDIPPYIIAAGNPAKIIRKRFSRRIVKRLLKIKWWDWPPDRIIAAYELMSSPDIDAFMDYAKKF